MFRIFTAQALLLLYGLSVCLGATVADTGRVDEAGLCMTLPDQNVIEKQYLGFPVVGFSWCATDNAMRFPAPLNIDLPKGFAQAYHCEKKSPNVVSPMDRCYIQKMVVQELSNATLVKWNNSSRRQDMRISIFVMPNNRVVFYETTTATVLNILSVPLNNTVRSVQTIRFSPQRFFLMLTANMEHMISAFDSNRVDLPSVSLYIQQYRQRRYLIRSSKLFAPGRPLDDLSGIANTTSPSGNITTAHIMGIPLPTPSSIKRLAAEDTYILRNDSLYLLDLVTHLSSRTNRVLVTRIDYRVSHDGIVESVFLPSGGLFMMEIELDGVADEDIVQMHLTQQPAFGFVPEMMPYRPLLLLHDRQRVHILQLQTGLRSGALNWTDDSAPSLFYVVPDQDQYISSATLFVESIPRLVDTSSDGSPVWIVVTLTSISTKKSFVHFVLLPELSVQFDNDTRYDDPAQRAPVSQFCGYNGTMHWDSTENSCTSRLNMLKPLDSPTRPHRIVTRAVERFVTDVYLPKPLPSAINIWPIERPAHTAVFILSDRKVEVYGLAPVPFQAFDVMFQKMSEFDFVGNVQDFIVSPNGIHAFANVYRHRWELDAMQRFVDICEKLKDPNTTELERAFLEPGFVKPCEQYYRRPNINDFVQYVGMCPVIGVQCYSFYKTLIDRVHPGFYTANAFEQLPCPPGSFCPGGVKQTCPPGFICPGYGNIKPRKCETPFGLRNETCFETGLQAPLVCPKGSACIAPFLPPLPAAPGFFIDTNNTRGIHPCHEGEYCLLGRSSDEDRRCPGNFVCNTTSITPSLCACNSTTNYCSYCPIGSSIEMPCRAGQFCHPPNTTVECQPSTFCPLGTLAPELCPAGYYCPTPSEKLICPSGYFCPIGSITPSRCSVFTVCNEGSKDHSANFVVLVVGGVVLIAIVVAWKVSGRFIQRYRDKKIKEANTRAAEKRKLVSEMFAMQDHDSSEQEMDDDTSALLADSPLENFKDFVIDISFDKLGLLLPSGKPVLNGVTGEIRHSRVTAIMGPSGAGKTTFMTTLAGKAHYGKTVGDIFINGQPGSISKIKKLTGFVPQEDVMLRELTIRELFQFNAALRLPSSTTAAEREARVDHVLDVLGLGNLQYSIIGDERKRGISGGQRKRVNIGLELVASPRLLFLDEPTSGLDSTGSMEIVRSLRDVARKEQIPIVTVIHQPRYDIFTMFDDVLLLGPGGSTCYMGPSHLALRYFEMLGFKAPATANPADFFMDVISGLVPREGHPEFQREDLFRLWKHNRAKFAAISGTYIPGSDPPSLENSLLDDVEPSSEESSVDIPLVGTHSVSSSRSTSLRDMADVTTPFSLPSSAKRKPANIFVQFWLFFVRALLQQTRNIPAILADIVLVLLSAITFGVVFFDTQYIGPPPPEVCEPMPVEGLRLRCSLPILDPFPHMSIMTSIGLALPAAMAALRVFGPERVVFWRESSAGANTFAYFFGKDLAYYPSLIILPLLFSGIFNTFWSARAPFYMFWLLFLLVWWCATGIGYTVSVVLPPNLATMGAVVVIFGFSLFAGIKPTLTEMASMWFPMPVLPWLSPFRYSSEAFYLTEIVEWSKIYDVSSGLDIMGYKSIRLVPWLLVLGLLGFLWRLVAVIALELFDRKKRQ